MGISVEDAVKELQARETVFVAYSQATKLPYVTCGEDTMIRCGFLQKRKL